MTMFTEEAYLDRITGPNLVLYNNLRIPGLRVKRNSLNGSMYMATEVTGQVTPVSGAGYADGTQGMAFRQGRTGEMMVSQVHGRYAEQTVRNNQFYSYCAAQTMTQLATTMVGNILWNPPGSGVNLVIGIVQSSILVTSATTTGLVLGQIPAITAPTGLTAATRTGQSLIGYAGALSQQGKVLAYSAATLATAPVAFTVVTHNTAAINTVGEGDDTFKDFAGAFGVPPGNLLVLGTLGATAAASAVYSTIFWEEVPI